jgi:hypothetical protein
MCTVAVVTSSPSLVATASPLFLLWLYSIVARTGLLGAPLVASSAYGSDVFFADIFTAVSCSMSLHSLFANCFDMRFDLLSKRCCGRGVA